MPVIPARHFTPDEANAALAEVRPLVESMVDHRRLLLEARGRRAELQAQIAGNGGGIPPSELAEVQARVEAEREALARCVGAIHERGAIVKDLDRGLIDFPALRGEEEVLLCWLLGEERIGYWHGSEEGFAGRKPLPL